MTILDRLEGGDLRSDGNANEVAEEIPSLCDQTDRLSDLQKR